MQERLASPYVAARCDDVVAGSNRSPARVILRAARPAILDVGGEG